MIHSSSFIYIGYTVSNHKETRALDMHQCECFNGMDNSLETIAGTAYVVHQLR